MIGSVIVRGALGLIAALATTPSVDFFSALRNADARLATVAERLATANASLCDRRTSALGMVIHGIKQYREQDWPILRQVFTFAVPLSVEVVLPDGAAVASGVKPNDGVLAIGATTLPSTMSRASPATADRDRALAAIDAVTPGQPIDLTLLEDGQTRHVTVTGRPACRSHFEIVVGTGFDARADGVVVQLGERYFEEFTDEEIAVVVAHELAHNLLHHRERLDAAKVSRGLAGEFGRNARLIRETEDDADAVSVYLLANAGYDPYSPGRFWRAHATQIGFEGIFRSRTHASGASRAIAMDAIAKSIVTNVDRPIVPPQLANRDKPLT